jgi:uncharacterized membrane protein YkvI
MAITPVDRPTEWTSALVMLVLGVIAYLDDRNVAALVAVAGAVLPVLVTAAVVWWRSR